MTTAPPLKQTVLGPVLVSLSLVASIISSLGAPLIPAIATHFHVSVTTAQWSLTIALLSGAVSAPVMGRLGDGRFRRATIVLGVTVVLAGSAIAALAPNLATLLVGRGMQGMGLGLVPMAMATARDEMPPPKVPSMIAVLSVSSAAGVGAGYPISGLIAQAWGIRGAFWFGAIVSAIVLVGVLIAIPSTKAKPTSRGLDWLGAVLLTSALVPLLLAMAQGSAWGWSSLAIIVLFVVGVVFLAGWGWHETRTAVPLVELKLLRHAAVLAADACAMVLGVAMYMSLSAAVEFVQVPRAAGYGFGSSVVVAGTVLIPLAVLMMAGSRLLPALERTFGVRNVLGVGCLVVAASSAFFALFHASLWQAFFMMGVLGIGLGTTFAAIPGLIVKAVPPDETGSAMGFYQVVRYVGFSTGSALAAAVLSGQTIDGEPTLHGYTAVFWVSAVICVVAAVLPWILPTAKDATRQPSEVRLSRDELLPDASAD